MGWLALHAWLNGWAGNRGSALARIGEAAAELRQSPRDTFRAEWQYRLAMAHFGAGRDALARDWSLTAAQAYPRLRWPPVHVAALWQLNQRDEAHRQLALYEDRHGRFEPAQAMPRLPGDEPRFAQARARLLEALAAAR